MRAIEPQSKHGRGALRAFAAVRLQIAPKRKIGALRKTDIVAEAMTSRPARAISTASAPTSTAAHNRQARPDQYEGPRRCSADFELANGPALDLFGRRS